MDKLQNQNEKMVMPEDLANYLNGSLPFEELETIYSALENSEFLSASLDGMELFLDNEGEEALDELFKTGIVNRFVLKELQKEGKEQRVANQLGDSTEERSFLQPNSEVEAEFESMITFIKEWENVDKKVPVSEYRKLLRFFKPRRQIKPKSSLQNLCREILIKKEANDAELFVSHAEMPTPVFRIRNESQYLLLLKALVEYGIQLPIKKTRSSANSLMVLCRQFIGVVLV